MIEFTIKKREESNLKMSYFVISVVLYVMLILLPIIIFIKKVEKRSVIEYLKLNRNIKKGICVGILVSSIFILFVYIKNQIVSKEGFNTDIGLLWGYGILVGFIEEIPLRGFALEKLKKKMSFWNANIVVTIIFVLLHFPNWFINGTNIISSSITISTVSLCLGYLVNEYNSLWPAIICHSVFNIFFWVS